MSSSKLPWFIKRISWAICIHLATEYWPLIPFHFSKGTSDDFLMHFHFSSLRDAVSSNRCVSWQNWLRGTVACELMLESIQLDLLWQKFASNINIVTSSKVNSYVSQVVVVHPRWALEFRSQVYRVPPCRVTLPWCDTWCLTLGINGENLWKFPLEKYNIQQNLMKISKYLKNLMGIGKDGWIGMKLFIFSGIKKRAMK